MSQITLARTNPNGSVVESFTVEDRVNCTALDGTEDSYEIGPDEFLGSGGNAIVYGCRNIGSGESFAIKIQTNTQSKRLDRFNREEKLLRSVRHEQLMSCVGFGEIAMTTHRTKTENHPFVIMPLADTNLSNLVKTNLPICLLIGYPDSFVDCLKLLPCCTNTPCIETSSRRIFSSAEKLGYCRISAFANFLTRMKMVLT